MRRLCFGGSFNPVHHGHLICARAAAEAAGFDRVVLIPAAVPPHKPGSACLAGIDDRLAMCRLAAGMQPGLFEVSDVEARRSGPSYTLDTVISLKSLGWKDLHWLIGADMLQILPTWHRAEELLQEVQFWIMARPGWAFDFGSLPPAFRALEGHILPAPLLEISATDIRGRVQRGLPIDFLVPEAVGGYIRAHGLYR